MQSSKYDIELVGIDVETMMFTDAVDDRDEMEDLFEKLSPSGGAELFLRELVYNRNGTYQKTRILKSKNSRGQVTEY